MGSVRTRALMDYFRHNFPLFTAKKGTEYQSSQFWDKIYATSKEKNYEWGCEPKDLLVYNYRPARRYGMTMTATIQQTIPDEMPSLVIGAGSSRIGDMLHEQNYQPVIQTDFSKVVIEQKRKEYQLSNENKRYQRMYWEYADARESLRPLLKYLEEDFKKEYKNSDENEDGEIYFGSVIDKGLIDALYLANNHAEEDISKIVSNVIEVLDPDYGVFLTLSRSHPDYLEPYLKNSGFLSIEARRLEYPDIYLYRLCKGERALVFY